MSKMISVTRALAQIKALDERIARSINKAFVSYEVGGKPVSGVKSLVDEQTTLRSNFQSVRDMLEERNKLKAAVIVSNATTVVEIAGVKMSVAQAIERKSSVALEQSLLDVLIQQYRQTVTKVERDNGQAKARLDTLLQQVVGKDRKVDEAEVAAITGPFLAQNMASLIDPLDIAKVITELEAKIQNFLTEVDYTLSESNAVTMIEIS